jgi:hypothetical protein
MVEDGVGTNDAWAALTRGRLRHLEGLGLAVRSGRRYRLDGEMEIKLRTLQARRDIIRTMNQRRLEGAKDVRPLGQDKVRGVVVRTGFHDEAGAAPWVVVRDAGGVEHYARLRDGQDGAARSLELRYGSGDSPEGRGPGALRRSQARAVASVERCGCQRAAGDESDDGIAAWRAMAPGPIGRSHDRGIETLHRVCGARFREQGALSVQDKGRGLHFLANPGRPTEWRAPVSRRWADPDRARFARDSRRVSPRAPRRARGTGVHALPATPARARGR